MKNQSIISKDDVLKVVCEALNSKIGERLNGWSSPINGVIDGVIKEHEVEIANICRDALASVVTSKEFKASVKQEFTHKVAKSLVAKLEGTVERAVEKLRQDQGIRARMILAIEKIIEENE